MNLRHGRAFGGARQAKPIHLAGGDGFGPLPQQAFVDDPAQRRADRAPDGDGGQAQNGAAHGPADGGACRGKKDRRHQFTSVGKENRATTRRAQGALRLLSITPRPE